MRPWRIPEDEIRFAAKTGFLTKTLWEEFFATPSRSWRFKRWRSFVESGVFLPHPSALAKHAIVPNPKNSHVRELVGGETSAAPFVAQLEHDETVARILLRLSQTKTIQSFITEAEQKRHFLDERRWQDRQERLKFPDAILSIEDQGSQSNWALEVELTAKSQKRYRKMFDTYRGRKQLKGIIFVVASTVIFKAIRSAIKATQYPDRLRPVGFGRLDEWMKSPESAAIEFINGSRSLLTMTHHEVGRRPSECA